MARYKDDLGRVFDDNDPINPDYYRKGGIETADFIEAKGLDFFEGNTVKYIVRHKDKGGLEDLKKARWYLERKITQLEAEK